MAYAAAAQQAPAGGETVVGVELHLPSGADPTGFAELVAIETGEKLSIRAVRRTVERLFATGRLADVVVTAVKAEGGVTLRFELTPKQQITAIRVKNNQLLGTRAIVAASKLVEGTEYYPERLEQASRSIERAYLRRGYGLAKVDVELAVSPIGVSVLFVISEGAPTRIVTLSFPGAPGLPLYRILEVLGIQEGSVLDLDRLDAGLEKLRAEYRRNHFYRAKLGEPILKAGLNGTAVAIPIDSGPKYGFDFNGNRSFRDQVLLAVLHYDGGEILDRDLIGRLARRLENFYRYRGFNDVRVVPHEKTSPDSMSAVLTFDIDEGPPMILAEVSFDGCKQLDQNELKRILAGTIEFKSPELIGDVHPTDDPLELEGHTASSARASEPDPDPRTVFVEDAYREAADTMTQVYRDRGFLDARVSLAELHQGQNGRASVRFRVSEGVQTLVRQVSYRGIPQGFDLKSVQGIQAGQPLSATAVENTRSALVRELGRKGYLFAQAEPTQQISEDHQSAILFFDVNPGPQVRVGRVILQGLSRTHSDVVRANLQVHPGEVLDPEELFESQRNLVVLGVFRQVAVRLIDPEVAEPVKDVVVEVKEAPRLDGNVFGGYSLVDGPQVGGDVLYPNLTGRAINLSARARANYVGLSSLPLQENQGNLQGINGLGGRGSITVQQPRIYAFLPRKLGARMDLVVERVFRPSYRFTRFAALLGTDWTVYRWLNLSLQYEIEHDRLRVPDIGKLLLPVGLTEEGRLRFPIGNFTLHTVRPGFALDFRDDVANPHRGVLIAGAAEITRDLKVRPMDSEERLLPSFPIFTLKLSGSVTFYVPVSRRVTLAIQGRGGRIFKLDPNSQTIAPKRFYLGGTSTMRGFREDGLISADRTDGLHQELAQCRSQLNPFLCTRSAKVLQDGREVPSDGGELFTLGKAELRFPLTGSFDLGVFLEAGNLWLSVHRYKPAQLRYTSGIGLRYGTPIGPLALDLGLNMFPDMDLNESTFQVHFSIGLF